MESWFSADGCSSLQPALEEVEDVDIWPRVMQKVQESACPGMQREHAESAASISLSKSPTLRLQTQPYL